MPVLPVGRCWVLLKTSVWAWREGLRMIRFFRLAANKEEVGGGERRSRQEVAVRFKPTPGSPVYVYVPFRHHCITERYTLWFNCLHYQITFFTFFLLCHIPLFICHLTSVIQCSIFRAMYKRVEFCRVLFPDPFEFSRVRILQSIPFTTTSCHQFSSITDKISSLFNE